MGFIYKITSPSKKLYVGQTKRKVPEKRWKQHCWESRSGKTHALGNAIRKYGAENMTFEVIEECPDDMLNEREHFWIEKLKSLRPNGYNLTTGGGAYELCEESREKISATRRKKSIDGRGYIGYIRTDGHGSLPFRAFGVRDVYLGTFLTLEEAETTLREYTRDPENFVPALVRRKPGTGSVQKEKKKWLVQIKQNKETIRIGLYETKGEADDALEEYLRAPDDFTLPELQMRRKMGTGGVRMRGHRYEANFGRKKYLGRFDSKDEAEAAIQAHIASQTV